MSLIAHAATHPGKVRPQNEDAILSIPDRGLFVVADGMGGVNAGEVASRMAVETIERFIADSRHDATTPFGSDDRLSAVGNRLRTAIKLANRAVFRASDAQPEFSGMGTTVAALLVDGHTAAICGVGDSRVYVAENGGLRQLTHDQTWIEALRTQNPSLDPAMLAKHPMRHVLTNVVGGHGDVHVVVTERTLAPGERFLLCSDGVYRGVPDDQLLELMRTSDVEAAANAIVSTALELDGGDNLSAIVISVTA